MAQFLFRFAILFLLSLPVWSQGTVQDIWTAPSAPDGATTLVHGAAFTIIWKADLRDSFSSYCPQCDPTKVDLWVTSFNGDKYRNKIGRNVDVTSETSFSWVVSINTLSTTDTDSFVFRFTYSDAQPPFSEQISSPGFKISGLPRASSSAASSSTPSPSASSSLPASSSESTSASTTPDSSTPPPSNNTDTPSSSKNNAWIAGVVIGPIAGIALGAAIMWFFLRRRKNKQNQPQHADMNQHSQGYNEGYGQTYQPAHSYQDKQSHTAMVEAPDHSARMELGDHK